MTIAPLRIIAAAGVLAVGLLDLSTAHAAEEPRFCTQEYAPVCGVRYGDQRTFSNACHAGVAGYQVTHRGECGERVNRDRDRVTLDLRFGTPYYYGYPAYRPDRAYPRVYHGAPRRHYHGSGSAHVAWCHDRYRSYRASDNTFQPYNGPRRECRSPFWG